VLVTLNVEEESRQEAGEGANNEHDDEQTLFPQAQPQPLQMLQNGTVYDCLSN